MAGQNPDSNSADLFDAYFRKADLDGDGQISGAEAVAFFQGSNLPKSVLAQVWSYADQKRLGYLGRQEFYNALKLVTVAQSKRELTPDIVKAALYSGASAKIPAPQINLAATPTLQSKTVTTVSQSSGTTPSPAQALGAQGGNGVGNASSNLQFQAPPNQLVRPQFQAQPNQLVRPQFQAQPNQLVRPAQTMPAIASSQPQLPAGQVMPGGGSMPASQPPTSNASTNRLSRNIDGTAVNKAMASAPNQDGFGMTGLHLTPNVQPSPQAIPGHAPVVASKPQDSSLPSNQLSTSNSKELAISGNGFASDSLFGDVFSATPAKQSTTSFAAGPIVPTSTVPTSGPHQPATPNSSEALAGSLLQQPLGGQHQQHQLSGMQNKQVTGQSTVAAFTTGAPNQQASVQSVASATSTGLPVGAGSVVSSQSTQIQASWPKMTPADVQKYTKVFLQVDTDRDGKITGEQARNLFLSWRLPREVLKQVWDLSDQDNDSMLSLREFCTALYLMERYREGRPLPSALPSPIMPDQMPPPFSGQPTAPLSGSWRPAHGYPQPQVMNVARPPLPSARNRPPRPSFVSQADANVQPTRSKLKVPELEKNLIDQLSQEEQDSLNAKFREATEANKKVEELEKEIEDSRAKIEGYHARMQELVVYKSRCDNRLNEITERVIADKREAEGLAKKYEEKYRQAGDVASRLTIEEATFRDIQEKKMELYQALVKIEQGDNAKEAFQERANHIQSGLEELVKTLNKRCKQYGLRSKPTTLLELPFGWQSGIQGGAADWSEDWDKFEDEGFTFVKELTLDVQNVIASPKPKSSFVQKEAPSEDVSTKPSSPSALPKLEKDSSSGKQKQEKEMENEQSENLVKSPSSPARSVALGNQSQDFPNSPVESSHLPDGSPNAKESSNQGGAESVLSGGKNFDEPGWGTFDTHYDAESVWGFDKENDHERRESTSLFGLGEFNIKPIRIQSSQADTFQGNSSSIFDSSVPSTPAYPDNLFQGRSSSIFDNSVPSTPAYADDGFKGRSSSLFADSVPSTPAYADNMFNGKVGSAFADSVPSTPAYSDNAFGGRNSSFFSDSVPSTPAYNFGNSDSFNSFSRFDSLRMNDSGPFQSPSLARFDSVRSTRDSEQGYGFPPLRFDSFNARDGNDSGSFQSPGSLARFDSMHSTTYSDHGHEFPSFDDADPFGSTGPFKSTMGSQTPRRDSDH